MQHLRWPLTGFETLQFMQFPPPLAKQSRYPIRYLRYWFGRSVLADLHARLKRPLRVLEVGVDNGDMLCFMGGSRIAGDRFALPEWIERWDALDVKVNPTTLERYSYSDFISANIEGPGGDWRQNRSYDAVVALHVLEHLLEPESAMRQLLAVIRPGGILVGGSPTMPSALASVHEPQLRRKNIAQMHDVRIHKHLSVITPSRIRRFARAEKLAIELLAGTFFLRSSGSPLENSALWVRANLLWGALFPALGGEVCFSLCTPKNAMSH